MSYHNSYYNLNSYFATSTAGGDEFPFLNQSPSVDPSNGQAYDVLTDRWGMVPQRGPTVGLPASLLGTTGSSKCRYNLFSDPHLTRESSDSVAGATPYGKGFDGLAESSYPNPCWPMVSQQPHPGHPGFSCCGTFRSDSTMAPGAHTVFPPPVVVRTFLFPAN